MSYKTINKIKLIDVSPPPNVHYKYRAVLNEELALKVNEIIDVINKLWVADNNNRRYSVASIVRKVIFGFSTTFTMNDVISGVQKIDPSITIQKIKNAVNIEGQNFTDGWEGKERKYYGCIILTATRGQYIKNDMYYVEHSIAD